MCCAEFYGWWTWQTHGWLRVARRNSTWQFSVSLSSSARSTLVTRCKKLPKWVKTALKTHLYKEYLKWYSDSLPSYLPPLFALPHPLLHSFCTPMCVCVCVYGIQYYDYTIYYFGGFKFNVYIVVILWSAMCSLLSVSWGSVEMTTIIVTIFVRSIPCWASWWSRGQLVAQGTAGCSLSHLWWGVDN